MKIVQVNEFGGPEVLRLVDRPDPIPTDDRVLVEVAAAGVNYRDLNHRGGARGGNLPLFPGSEGSGRVIAIGAEVTTMAVGDRVAWKSSPGSYATLALVPESELVPIPPAISEEVAAAVLLQGSTAHYLAHSVFPLEEGDFALVHAAAGGVGLLLTQMLTHRGIRVLGTVSSEQKANLILDFGAEAAIRYDKLEFAPRVRELTRGAGVAIAYDAIGKSTFEGSFESLRERGCLALYGLASGPVPPFNLDRLGGGSFFITRPDLTTYTRSRKDLLKHANAVFDLIESGTISVHIGGRYPLERARDAHADLASRTTIGKLLLIPPD